MKIKFPNQKIEFKNQNQISDFENEFWISVLWAEIKYIHKHFSYTYPYSCTFTYTFTQTQTLPHTYPHTITKTINK